ncbi:MAG: hypothetical protein ACI9AV_000549 [Sediminicola sp.]|jgi:hypothetical protein
MLTSKTFFGILFEVPLPTALEIEAVSFFIFSPLCWGNMKKIQRIAHPFFKRPARFLKKGTPKKSSLIHIILEHCSNYYGADWF